VCVATEIVLVAVWPFEPFAVSRYVCVAPLHATVRVVLPDGPYDPYTPGPSTLRSTPVAFCVAHDSVTVGGGSVVLTSEAGQAIDVVLDVYEVMTGEFEGLVGGAVVAVVPPELVPVPPLVVVAGA
jgi:hypothetical protein